MLCCAPEQWGTRQSPPDMGHQDNRTSGSSLKSNENEKKTPQGKCLKTTQLIKYSAKNVKNHSVETTKLSRQTMDIRHKPKPKRRI